LTASSSADRPGSRIQGYRNSTPRTVEIAALGSGAGWALAGAPVRVVRADGWDAVAEGGLTADLTIVVCRRGDPIAVPEHPRRPAGSLSLIVLEGPADRRIADDTAIARLLRIADTAVSTRDPEFVHELAANLAS
jgi:hypothetical protein